MRKSFIPATLVAALALPATAMALAAAPGAPRLAEAGHWLLHDGHSFHLRQIGGCAPNFEVARAGGAVPDWAAIQPAAFEVGLRARPSGPDGAAIAAPARPRVSAKATNAGPQVSCGVIAPE